MYARRRLRKLLKKHERVAAQRSVEWLAKRPRTIGGSEFATLCGTNKYSSILKFIEQKVGLSFFSGNVNTMWGSNLEALSAEIFEELCRQEAKEVEIYEAAGLPGRIPDHWYSPDGIAVIDGVIRLLEFKNAGRRVANGSIPNEYYPQIFCGLDAIRDVDSGAPLAAGAIYVDTTFRRCALSQWVATSPQYDREMHGRYTDYGEPAALCMVGFYGAAAVPGWEREPRCDGGPHGGPHTGVVVDLGACSLSYLEATFSSRPVIKYHRHWPRGVPRVGPVGGGFRVSQAVDAGAAITCVTAGAAIERLRGAAAATLIGVLPLKMFEMYAIPVAADSWRPWVARACDGGDAHDPHWAPPDMDAATFTEAFAETASRAMSTVFALLDLPTAARQVALNEVYGVADGGEEELAGDVAESPPDEMYDELAADMLAAM
jgi:hypothetical protein